MVENSVSLPKPKFWTMGTDKDRIYCQTCLVGCVAKYQIRPKLEKHSGNVNFKAYADNHKYNKVFLDWQNIFFFYLGFFFTNIDDTQDSGEGGEYLLNSFLTFHILHRYLDINWAIAAESSSLYIASSRTRTFGFWAQVESNWAFRPQKSYHTNLLKGTFLKDSYLNLFYYN